MQTFRRYLRMPIKIGWTALLLVGTAAYAWPQARFEVASIHPSPPAMTASDGWNNLNAPGDRLQLRAMTVGDILDMLGGWQLFRVVGGPKWMTTDRYDIEAKADRPLEFADRQAATMALLADRFHLQSHRETREAPGIVLRAPAKGREDLKQAAGDEHYSIRMESGDMVFTSVPISALTNRLSQMWQAPVVDETELKGMYDIRLRLSNVDPSMSWGDRVREAVEAIGIRVENRRVPLEVTVVDRCDRPTDN